MRSSALTSRSPFVAGTNALGSGRALHNDKVFGTIDRFLDLHETPLEFAALLSFAFAIWRRDKATVALSIGAIAWVAPDFRQKLAGENIIVLIVLDDQYFQAKVIHGVRTGCGRAIQQFRTSICRGPS